MSRIEGPEGATILGLGAFGVVWIVFVIPYLTGSAMFLSFPSPVQYLLYNVGFVVLTTVIFGAAFSVYEEGGFDLGHFLRVGISSFIGFAALDDWEPPDYLTPTGQVAITNPGALPQTAVDAAFAWLGHAIGVPNVIIPVLGVSTLYLFVYLFMPLGLIVLMAFVLKPRTFLKYAGFGA